MPKKKDSRRIMKELYPYLIMLVIVAVASIFIFAFLGNQPKKENLTFGAALDKVNKIDASYNLSLLDYSRGLLDLKLHPRWPDPLNYEDIDNILQRYSSITGPEDVLLLVNFRKSLLSSEEFYRHSYDTYKTDIQNYGLVCENDPYFYAAAVDVNQSVYLMNMSLGYLSSLQTNYPADYAAMNVPDNVTTGIKNSIIDITAEMNYKLRIFNRFCGALNATNVSVAS